MKRFHWELFALLFSVSIENFGFMVSTPFFFLLKNVFLNCIMSKMHVNHSRVPVDFLQCASAESKTAKLVEDIGSEYCIELKALQIRSLSFWPFSQEVNQ